MQRKNAYQKNNELINQDSKLQLTTQKITVSKKNLTNKINKPNYSSIQKSKEKTQGNEHLKNVPYP